MLARSRALQASASVSVGFDIKALSCHLTPWVFLFPLSKFIPGSDLQLKKKKAVLGASI